jgi:glycosyltransferase involved in cell wall biosynthesis
VASAGRALILDENLSVPFDRRVWQEARSLAQAGYEVSVVCPRGDLADREDYACIDSVRIHRFDLPEAGGGLGGYLREYGTALRRMTPLARRLGTFDLVHVCNPPDLLFLIQWAMRPRPRLIFDQHDLVPELYLSRFQRPKDPGYWAFRALERTTYATATAVISTNESYRERAIARGGKGPYEVFVVRTAPDLSRFSRVAPKPELKGDKEHLLVYLGVMGPQDGVDYAVRALAELRRMRSDDWRAVFVGDGDARPEAEQLAGELGLGDAVEFTGRVSDEVLLDHLSTADIGLAPDPRNPLNDVSTMNKILEYMACGRPIVAFDLLEARRSAGEAALYATPNDEAEMARCINELLNDPADRERRGRIGRERIEGDLSWQRSEEALLAAYEYALNRA